MTKTEAQLSAYVSGASLQAADCSPTTSMPRAAASTHPSWDSPTGITKEEFDKWLCAQSGVPYEPDKYRNKKMSERDLSRELRSMVNERQLWGHASFDYYRRTGAGWVDWVIIGPSGILFRELKSAEGILSPEQRYVQEMFTRFGLDCAVWRPEDFTDGTMARELDAIATRSPGA
jgi:hypothetical protein